MSTYRCADLLSWLAAAVLLLVPVSVAEAQFSGPITWLLARNASKAPPTRIAILIFGPPPELRGNVVDALGVTIDPEPWKAVVPLLEADRADVVIVRMNSGGGDATFVEQFRDVFVNDFKPRFRTIAWIESAIGNASLCALPIDEWAMTPDGSLGWASCIGYGGDRFPCKDMRRSQLLESMIEQAEIAARAGHRDPALARAMLLQTPLSADFAANGAPALRPDEEGVMLLNRKGAIMNLDAKTAQKAHLSIVTAASREQLAESLGYSAVEWVGERAAAAIDSDMRKRDAAFKSTRQLLMKYMTSAKLAFQTDRPAVRSEQVAKAKPLLAQLKTSFDTHAGFCTALGPCPEWLDEQFELLEKFGSTPIK